MTDAKQTPARAETAAPKPAPARPAAFGLRTAALAGMLIAGTALPGAAPAAALTGVFSEDATVLACPPFPTCCGTIES